MRSFNVLITDIAPKEGKERTGQETVKRKPPLNSPPTKALIMAMVMAIATNNRALPCIVVDRRAVSTQERKK